VGATKKTIVGLLLFNPLDRKGDKEETVYIIRIRSDRELMMTGRRKNGRIIKT
jgi:hypothetical protein